MKSDMKKMLEEAFAAPQPKRKKEFLKKAGKSQISNLSFLLLQISYIRKRVFIVSAFISALALMSVDYAGSDCIWVVSAMMPFVALCAVTENARSATYGMAELEMASRFSLKSIILARLSVIGLLHFTILGVLIFFVGKSVGVLSGMGAVYLRTSVYLFVPYLLTSVLGLVATRRFHGKETIYMCMGISVMVSCLNFILKANIPVLYEEKQFLWWCVFLIYLVVKAGSEYKKAIYQTEDLAWN